MVNNLRIPLLCFHRTNRTRLRDELYAIGKLKEGVPGEPCEDDLMLSTRIKFISSIKFFNHLQLGDGVGPKETSEIPWKAPLDNNTN